MAAGCAGFSQIMFLKAFGFTRFLKHACYPGSWRKCGARPGKVDAFLGLTMFSLTAFLIRTLA